MTHEAYERIYQQDADRAQRLWAEACAWVDDVWRNVPFNELDLDEPPEEGFKSFLEYGNNLTVPYSQYLEEKKFEELLDDHSE